MGRIVSVKAVKQGEHAWKIALEDGSVYHTGRSNLAGRASAFMEVGAWVTVNLDALGFVSEIVLVAATSSPVTPQA